jgi:hypothetical protein
MKILTIVRNQYTLRYATIHKDGYGLQAYKFKLGWNYVYLSKNNIDYVGCDYMGCVILCAWKVPMPSILLLLRGWNVQR